MQHCTALFGSVRLFVFDPFMPPMRLFGILDNHNFDNFEDTDFVLVSN